MSDKGSNVEISVKDNGIGIEEKYLENIFNRFGQVDKSLCRIAEGSGIGLSLVKSIVEMHGGEITVESKAGEGSIFKIELPAIKIYKLYDDYKFKHYDNIAEMIKIEFSDID
ncbi:Sensor-like histidine kinase senX3 [bioreactor metagenome]|uniref:histidine kinase n=1 Tax=bioreactor metagenome TaxID=1076179 RepID=A0A645G424_9ZZZZ